jgi:hypothetical protein
MAESDAAGPAPISGPQPPAQKGSRSLTLAEIQRDISRQLEPLRAAQREAERGMAPMLAAARTVERQQQQIAAMVDRAIGPYLRTLTGAPAQKKPAAPSQDSAGRPPSPAPAAPAFDASPAAMSALVDTVAAEVLKTLAGSRTGETAAFTEEIRAAVADEVRKAFAEVAASKKDRKPRGDSTDERLRDLHTNIDPEFALLASERKVGERIDRSPGTFPDSHYWRTVLKPAREEARLERKKVRGAQRWGHFDSVGRRDEDPEAH